VIAATARLRSKSCGVATEAPTVGRAL